MSKPSSDTSESQVEVPESSIEASDKDTLNEFPDKVLEESQGEFPESLKSESLKEHLKESLEESAKDSLDVPLEKNQVEDQDEEPASELDVDEAPEIPASFYDFSLHKLLQKSINELGFTVPTPVQEEVIPLAIDGIDLKVNAETGSGKTVAYLLPTLHQLLSRANPDAGTRALVLLPTRELALQVHRACEDLAKHTNLVTTLVTGGDDVVAQAVALEKNPQIVVATPGRLLKLIEKGTVDLFKLDVLVIDEADRMLDMGFSNEVLSIVDSCSEERQTLLLSATLNGIHGPASEILRDPETVSLDKVNQENNAQENIVQQVVLADNTFHKQTLTYELLESEEFEKAIVFTNSKTKADRLGSYLMHKRLRVGVLHGDLDPEKRLRVMELLRHGKINILIASDLAARGLDISGIGLVINFEMPRRGDTYVHRIGRTGRAGNKGLAISLIYSLEWNLMISIERYLKRQFVRRVVEGFEGSYKGPSRVKNSGKAAGTNAKKLKLTASEKVKKRKKQKKKQDKKLKKKRAEGAVKPAKDSSVSKDVKE